MALNKEKTEKGNLIALIEEYLGVHYPGLNIEFKEADIEFSEIEALEMGNYYDTHNTIVLINGDIKPNTKVKVKIVKEGYTGIKFDSVMYYRHDLLKAIPMMCPLWKDFKDESLDGTNASLTKEVVAEAISKKIGFIKSAISEVSVDTATQEITVKFPHESLMYSGNFKIKAGSEDTESQYLIPADASTPVPPKVLTYSIKGYNTYVWSDHNDKTPDWYFQREVIIEDNETHQTKAFSKVYHYTNRPSTQDITGVTCTLTSTGTVESWNYGSAGVYNSEDEVPNKAIRDRVPFKEYDFYNKEYFDGGLGDFPDSRVYFMEGVIKNFDGTPFGGVQRIGFWTKEGELDGPTVARIFEEKVGVDAREISPGNIQVNPRVLDLGEKRGSDLNVNGRVAEKRLFPRKGAWKVPTTGDYVYHRKVDYTTGLENKYTILLNAETTDTPVMQYDDFSKIIALKDENANVAKINSVLQGVTASIDEDGQPTWDYGNDVNALGTFNGGGSWLKEGEYAIGKTTIEKGEIAASESGKSYYKFTTALHLAIGSGTETVNDVQYFKASSVIPTENLKNVARSASNAPNKGTALTYMELSEGMEKITDEVINISEKLVDNEQLAVPYSG